MENLGIKQKLRYGLSVYAIQYEEELRKAKLPEEEIREKVNKFIDEACSQYTNSGNAKNVVPMFEFLNEARGQKAPQVSGRAALKVR